MPINPDDLDDRIARARKAASGRDPATEMSVSGEGGDTGLGFGLTAGAKMVAAVVLGGGLGWLIDRGLGTSPFGTLILMVLGFAGALVNVWLTINKAVTAAVAVQSSGEKPVETGARDTDGSDGKSA